MDKLDGYYLSEIYKSIVTEPCPFMIDLQAYTHHLGCQLLGEPSGLPPGAEDFVGIHMMLLIGPDEFDLLEDGTIDLTDLIEGLEDEDSF